MNLKNLQIKKAEIKRFRSIQDISLEFQQGELLILCGPNNIGKTNILRALDLFFSLDINKFDPKIDIPYHIAEGSRGQNYNSEIIVTFIDLTNGDKYNIGAKFIPGVDGNEDELSVKGAKNNTQLTQNETEEIIKYHKFMFIESNNIDLPKIISEIFKSDVLSDLDKLRKKQDIALQKLQEFFNESKVAVSKIETEVTSHFKKFVNNIEGINTQDWECKIIFPEFDYLREAISNLVDFTLKDTNDRAINTKGSGIQRMLLLALISYISDNFKEKIIWAIDEPEVFLQPGLQKSVFQELTKLGEKLDIIITTHSTHFINLSNLSNTHLLDSTQIMTTYKRKKNEIFIKVNTIKRDLEGIQKIEAIRKHMGITRNDSWEVVPFNILVEGESDKNYITALAQAFGLEVPNILISGGVDKIPSYLEFLSNFCKDLNYKPKFICILDHDKSGRDIYKKLKDNSHRYSYFNLTYLFIPRCDNKTNSEWNYSIEDFIYPDIMFNSANKILDQKAGYNKITKNDQNSRFASSFMSLDILTYITRCTQTSNIHQSILNFDSEQMKKYLCELSCYFIGTNIDTTLEYDKKYPEVKKFLEKILADKSD